MMKVMLSRLRVRYFIWFLMGALIFSLVPGLILYWQQVINLRFLLFWILALMVIGLIFTFGIRFAQKDGFLDGYTQARNNFDKQKKG